MELKQSLRGIMKLKSEFSEELLSQLSPLERKFLVSWEKLEKSEEFKNKLKEVKEPINKGES